MRALALVLAAAAALAASVNGAAAPAVGDCGGGPEYAYAGHQAASASRGVRATITPLEAPVVAAGHVAAWVGVGGPGAGPGGSDEWLQVGVAAYSSGRLFVYVESERAGEQPQVRVLRNGVQAGDAHRLAIVSAAGDPDRWRIWVDGVAVGSPVLLPGSGARWQPIATTESWGDRGSACNSFAFRFERVEVVGARAGAWRPFVSERRLLDPGFAVQALRGGAFGFVARSV